MQTLTFPLMFDVILYIEVNCNVGSDTSRPALPNVRLGNLNNGERADGLSHPGPASEHHTSILRFPVKKDRRQTLDNRRGQLSRLEIS